MTDTCPRCRQLLAAIAALLDDASEDTCNDNQTKYSCDWGCQLDFTFTSPEDLDRFSERLKDMPEVLSVRLVSVSREQVTVCVDFRCNKERAAELV